MTTTQLYFKCLNCGTINEIGKGSRARKYCNRKCRDAAYYKRKTAKLA